MLGLGVILGAATDQVAQSAGYSTVLLEMPAAAPSPEEPREAPEPVAEAAPEATAEPVAEAPLPSSVPLEEPLPEAEEPPHLPPELPEEEGLPEVRHVFLIVLGENGYEATFGEGSAAPYLAQKLPSQGELLPNYFAVTQGSLANEIAILSGQGPTPETAANCPTYSDVAPGTVSAEGQIEGGGCVYPATTETLPGQLVAAGLEWRAYVEDIGNGAGAGQPAACRHPALGAADPSHAPVPGDGYLTWRNPLVYFHSIVDSPECTANDVGLDRLAADLGSAKRTPALSYIVPNACHGGGEVPCEPGAPTGAPAAEAFLRRVVPAIVASPAYKEGGLIAITAAQAPQAGEGADPSACCVAPAYPNLPLPVAPPEPATGPVKPTGGGGRVGMLLISPFVEPGTVNETTYANHFTLLLTIEELFGLEKLGYANELALAPFDSAVFNRAESAEP
jgi:phosphatidylinositol-3-phosphatase